MKILIVGSGAVGKVYALGLQKVDVDIAFYTRSVSAEKLLLAQEQGGIPLYQISHTRRKNPISHSLTSFRVITDRAGSKRFNPDQIWFTTPSQVYYSDWFQDFLREVPTERVVCFTPEGFRSDFIPEGVSGERFVFGGITFVAWQTDLEGELDHTDAVNFWLPPFLEIPLMGEVEACNEVAALLRSGGFRPSVKGEGFHNVQASVTALMTTLMAGLELSGWSLREFRKSSWLKVASAGAREAIYSQLSDPNLVVRSLIRIFTSWMSLFVATFFLPRLFPFDLEKYLMFHYQKTREQTLTLLEVFMGDAEWQDLPVTNIHSLLQGLVGKM